MKQRIYHSLCLIALLSLFLSTITSLSLYMDFHTKESQRDLQAHCSDIAIAASRIESYGGDILSFLQEVANTDAESVRITLIQPDGTVSWDSAVEASSMGNHRDREEIAEALEGGMGEASRVSDTLGQDSYYCALQFGQQDLILRLGRDGQNWFTTLMQIMPLDLCSCVLLFAVCLVIANQETARIVDPMLNAANHLETLDYNDFYVELVPFINTIRSQNHTIRAQLESIQQDRDTITLILKNMQEGLVMLSMDKRILSVNNSAMEMLGSLLRKPEGQTFLVLTRDPTLVRSVDSALKGESCSGFIDAQHSDRIYQYFTNPVLANDGSISGVILFLMDVTQQQRAQRSREEFSANVSHELKTPLTSISGFAELMESGMASSTEDVKMFSGLIRKESSRLLKLIDDIIHLSRIEDIGENQMEAIDLYALVQEECEYLEHPAQQRHISIEVCGHPAIIKGNRTMLQEAVYNLCENAVKYNKDGGSVTVSVLPVEQQVQLSVSDTGIGIPREHHEHIFERFYRVDKSRSKETGGTGLGLSIVKHVVQHHQGQLSIDSEIGKGTTITATFPIFPMQ